MKTLTVKTFLLLLLVTSCICSCKKKQPYDLGEKEKPFVSVKYEDLGKIKVIPIKINGTTVNMIYDTGCSGIHLSYNEIYTLLKNGKIDQGDFTGIEYSRIADGSIVENDQIIIREIEIGEGENTIKLHDKTATISRNLDAPVLLGNDVLDEMARVETDNINKTINFYKK